MTQGAVATDRGATAPGGVGRPRWGVLAGGARRAHDLVTGWAASTSRLELVVLLTLLLVLLLPPDRPDGLVQLLALAALVYRPLARRASFWFVLVGLWVVLFLPRAWTTTDNHKYLLIYWCLAVGLAMLSADPLRVLGLSGRLLVGLVFLCATAWKVASPDFPDGGFFHFTLLSDARFAPLAEVFGGLPDGGSASNGAAVDAWDDPTAAVGTAALVDAPGAAAIGQAMAVGTIALEGAVAVAFLAPDRWRVSRSRDVLLLLFVLATYPIAPVVGFGWLLAIMGLAQTRLPRPFADVAYVVAFLVIFATSEAELVWALVQRVLP